MFLGWRRRCSRWYHTRMLPRLRQVCTIDPLVNGSNKWQKLIKVYFHFLLASFFVIYSALEFLSTCKLANLTVKAELGCCLLHRSGRLIIEDCNLQCESNPLDYLSYAIITTAGGREAALPSAAQRNGDSVSVSETRIKGGAKAVLTSGTLALQRVRVIYGPTSILFWFDVVHQL